MCLCFIIMYSLVIIVNYYHNFDYLCIILVFNFVFTCLLFFFHENNNNNNNNNYDVLAKMAANTWMIPCFKKNDLQWCVEFSVNGFCCCLGFWSAFFFAPSAVLAFAVEASKPILAMNRWTKMFANAMTISCFMKTILLWLTGVCCRLGFWSAFFFAPPAVLAFAVEASKPILAMNRWTKMFANVMKNSHFTKNNFQWFVELSVVKLTRN